MSDDLLNSLGLASDETVTAGAETAGTEEAEATLAPADKVVRSEIKIVGTIAAAVGLLPAKVMPAGFGGGGKKGSKYPFASLVAPSTDEAGNVTGYSFFEVKLTDVENADAKKLQAAIQSAVAAQNKQEKEAGSAVKYVSRTVLDEAGAYAGTSVYRVDATLGDAE